MIASRETDRIALSEVVISPLDPRFDLLYLFERWSVLPTEQSITKGSWEVTMKFPWHCGKYTKANFDPENQKLSLEWDHYKDRISFKAPFAVAEMVVPDPYRYKEEHHCLVVAGKDTDEIVVFEADGRIQRIKTTYNRSLPSWLESHFLFAKWTKNRKKIKEFILVEANNPQED